MDAQQADRRNQQLAFDFASNSTDGPSFRVPGKKSGKQRAQFQKMSHYLQAQFQSKKSHNASSSQP
jgi:hypothetical protein